MGVFFYWNPFNLVSLLFLLLLLITLSLFIGPSCIAADDVVNGARNPSSSPPPPPPPPKPTSFSPFRPSIAVIVAVLTTMFSVTFLLLLYAKHCKRGHVVVIGHEPPSSAVRKNSGIDRTIIESLPVFRFGSLRGLKDGLECAVCLARFESTEVLRLLPKCKHAFHVECVDTWLDAHSTCPLCRYRVDPEDVLLIDDAKILPETHPVPPPENNDVVVINVDGANPEIRRVSGRHSSAGERGTGFLQFVLQRTGEPGSHDPTSFRRSLDSAGLRKKSESVAVGCFDRPRKDGLLLTDDRTCLERTRFEHRIIVSPGTGGFHQRWSDVQPSDLLYLQSEKIMSDSRRFSSSASGSRPRQQHSSSIIGGSGWWGGRGVINARSVSEITGLSRFPNTNTNNNNSNRASACSNRSHDDSRRAGVVSRWLAWISQTRPAPAVRSGRTTGIAA